ncbi:FecR family protein [SAR92 clade bacterium H246]
MTSNIYQLDDRTTIEAQAREWLIRLDRDQALSQQEKAELRQWADTSPAHKAELTRISAFWDDANILTELWTPAYEPSGMGAKLAQFGRWLSQRSWADLSWAALSQSFSGRQPLSPEARLGSYTVAATALVSIGIVYIAALMPSPTATNGLYVSAIGELHQQTLADGSVIQLNTDSQIQVDYSDNSRKIRLLRGEAHFDVSHNPDWPFEVYADQGMVKAVGTAFAVRLNPDSIKVVVNEGRVDLASVIAPAQVKASDTDQANTPAQPVAQTLSTQKIASLDLGQSAEFSRRGVTQHAAGSASQQLKTINHLAHPELERQLAWRTGYLVFEGDSLSNVVDEINRYSTVHIEIADPGLADIRVGGRFKVGELEAIFEVLETSFGIQVSHHSNHQIYLTAQKR